MVFDQFRQSINTLREKKKKMDQQLFQEKQQIRNNSNISDSLNQDKQNFNAIEKIRQYAQQAKQGFEDGKIDQNINNLQNRFSQEYKEIQKSDGVRTVSQKLTNAFKYANHIAQNFNKNNYNSNNQNSSQNSGWFNSQQQQNQYKNDEKPSVWKFFQDKFLSRNTQFKNRTIMYIFLGIFVYAVGSNIPNAYVMYKQQKMLHEQFKMQVEQQNRHNEEILALQKKNQ